MKPFQIEILAADRPFYIGECESLVIPTSVGQYGILADHSNMVTAMVAGKLTYRIPGEEDQIVAVSSGVAKIENNHILILADSIERPEEIDIRRAQEEADAAKEVLLQQKSLQEYNIAQAQLLRAMNRLRLTNHRELD